MKLAANLIKRDFLPQVLNHAGALLDRGAALALVVERWERSGIWVISRSDPYYPERLKRYLGQSAPALLYGVGSMDLLKRGGLAVVGSRDRSEEDGDFARRIGEHCAGEGITVISGAAKGIDRDAMSGALEAGRSALGILAEGVAKTAASSEFRSGLLGDKLTLLSPFDPDSRWFTYTAMERNKLLYGLSDVALVVASAADSGGTWAGATEAIKGGKVKVYVRNSGVVSAGNPKLVDMGGLPFPAEPWGKFRALFTPPEAKNGWLFPAAAPEVSAPKPPAAEQTPVPECDAYPLVISTLLSLLKDPQTVDWLADKMRVRAPQIKDWLERGVLEGRIQKVKRPLRYVAQTPTLFAK